MAHETWKPLPSSGGVYAISDLGRVRRETGGRGTRAGTIRKPARNTEGYLKVTLSIGNVQTQPLVHTLVLEAFVGPKPPGMVTNHKNGNKTDNRLVNLEWCTPSANNAHAYRTLDRKRQRGQDHGASKLTDAQAVYIRARARAGARYTDLARELGVVEQQVSRIARGLSWAWLNEKCPPVGVGPDVWPRPDLTDAPEWKAVPSSPSYEVSLAGEVRRLFPRETGTFHEAVPQYGDGHGYSQINGTLNGVRTTRKVHLLVAEAFLGPLPPGYQVNHQNGIKTDNRVENLGYLTPQANALHAVHVLKRKVARGEARSDFTNAKIREIRRRVAAGESRASVGRAFKRSDHQIGLIVARKSWAHVE
jgi:hypothetical protein